jgi:hypothetical protein
MIGRALVLAAGLGTRLHPLTLARAKAAAPVDGEISSSIFTTNRNPSPPSSATAAISAPAFGIRGSRQCSVRPAVRGTRFRCCWTQSNLVCQGRSPW